MIAELRTEQCGFVTEHDLHEVIRENKYQPLLIRCGGCRFVVPAKDLNHFMDIVNKTGDYVRDVSLLPQDTDLRRFPKIITDYSCLWVSAQDKNILVNMINKSGIDSIVMA